MTGNSLINLGELSKPATVLIEKISDAVGGIAKPWQIKRVANAEAEAGKIKALAQIEISDIEQRALFRMVREEGIKQENIESITAGAIPHLSESARPDDIDQDWLNYFFEKARLVSNSEMQSIWSKILSEEANSPETFSKRTIDFISKISKKDADLFTKYCTFAWEFHEIETIHWYKNNESSTEIVDNFGVTFSDLLHLESIGLIKFDMLSEFVFRYSISQQVAYYYGIPINIEFAKDGEGWTLNRGHAAFTQTGKELAKICGARPDRKYFERVLEKWISDGHSISTPANLKAVWTSW